MIRGVSACVHLPESTGFPAALKYLQGCPSFFAEQFT
ncbi:hypothetical protein BVIR_2489 [Blastochloris viridis]|uniref:Uncharacterized protein n=1 Tax=Blastochloris viridis TaxID=1079 RepID=A0A0P0J8N0_BLAVI|nr:hypothetical protein BVIR_2489 [Blastochloris viridis]CUU42917.1 hypothetical protein BVIRIDIS_19330 [Blastochloris viridis]